MKYLVINIGPGCSSPAQVIYSPYIQQIFSSNNVKPAIQQNIFHRQQKLFIQTDHDQFITNQKKNLRQTFFCFSTTYLLFKKIYSVYKPNLKLEVQQYNKFTGCTQIYQSCLQLPAFEILKEKKILYFFIT